MRTDTDRNRRTDIPRRSPALADPEHGRLDDIVRTDELGLDDAAATWWMRGRAIADDLTANGVAGIDGFLRADVVADIAHQLDQLRPFVPIVTDHRSVHARADVGDGHRAWEAGSTWVAGHVTRDMFPPHCAAHRLYVSPLFKALVAGIVGIDRVFEYADPLAGLVATVIPPGGEYGWHYDTNEYVVTVSVQPAVSGGVFEFHRDLRCPGDENLDGLAAVVIDDDRTHRRSANPAAGDLQVFAGRYSLHRVTTVGGAVDRLTLVLSYADRPGVIGPLDRTRRVYGRVTEAHLLAAQQREGVDGVVL